MGASLSGGVTFAATSSRSHQHCSRDRSKPAGSRLPTRLIVGRNDGHRSE
jgi:hypothetical protein